jgi:hypothetical protein
MRRFCVVFNNNVFVWFFSRHVLLLLTFFLLSIPNYQVSGQDVRVIYPDTIFPDMTIEYRIGGDFDYYNTKGQRVGGGRKQADGLYNIFYMGRIRERGYLTGQVPTTNVAPGGSTTSRQSSVQSKQPSYGAPGPAFESGANQYDNGTIGRRNMNNNTKYGNIDIKTGKTEIFTGEAMSSRVEARDARVKASEWGQRHSGGKHN